MSAFIHPTTSRHLLLSLLRSSVSRPLFGRHLHTTSRTTSSISLNPLKWFNRKPVKQEHQAFPALQATTGISEDKALLATTEERLEKFIPVTRRTLLLSLIEEKNMFSLAERQLMERFAAALDAHYSHRFYGILEETKVRKQLIF